MVRALRVLLQPFRAEGRREFWGATGTESSVNKDRNSGSRSGFELQPVLLEQGSWRGFSVQGERMKVFIGSQTRALSPSRCGVGGPGLFAILLDAGHGIHSFCVRCGRSC